VKGIRSIVYHIADNSLGYYEAGRPCLFYDESFTSLHIRVLFETKDHALRFDSCIRQEGYKLSPLNSLEIKCEVAPVFNLVIGARVYSSDYVPTDFDSPQETLSAANETISVVTQSYPEFIYQRIESDRIFGSHLSAESCHLISKAHCSKYPATYEKYDGDMNNRLAMSRGMHGYFYGLSTDVPLFNLSIYCISQQPDLDDRYRVDMIVTVIDQESAALVFNRLKEGSVATDNPLSMLTYVHVLDPIIFRRCLEWKEKEISKRWKEYLGT
jgi:hypothetical protein